jgi:AraC-like DNA-binding protein
LVLLDAGAFPAKPQERKRVLCFRKNGRSCGRVAVDCGYYDQSHLIHDFRFFSNLSPTEFVRQRSDCVMQNHATLVR